jgi:hypothetical protein
MTYAEGTTVSVEKSQSELVRILKRAGCTQHAFAEDEESGKASIVFALQSRQYRFDVAVPGRPSVEARVKRKPPRDWHRWDAARRERWIREQTEQGAREAWRLLVLATKAKVELVQAGWSSYQREFLADLMLPDGKTLGAAVDPMIQETYSSGRAPRLFEAFGLPPQLPERT